MIKSFIKRLFARKQEPSLIAQNVVWFTCCSWIEQLQAFDQLDKQLWKGKENI